MIRILLVVVAVLVAVLAFVFERPWLYVAAGVPLLGALGLLAQQLWTLYQQDESGEPRSSRSGDESLEDLGIVDVRPEDRDEEGDGTSAGPAAAKTAPAGPREADAEPESDTSSPSGPDAPSSPDGTATATPEPKSAPAVASDDRPVLGPFLESLRAALGAETVCLLVQEEVLLEYRIEALASTQPDVQRSGHFETQSPLLTATMSRQAVTVRSVDGEDKRDDLAFYDTPPAIDQMALAPVPQPDTADTVFLLADATAKSDLSASRARSLLERFAETVTLLWETDEAPVGREPPSAAPAANGTESRGDGAEPTASPTDDRPGEPRPRREIIAEEMKAADAGDDELALVLVHLNRAESIARRGEEAVSKAEELLRTRLEHLAPGERVERFGELTYGLFPRRGLEEVEAWAADLQEEMARESGELEGGVSIGVAVRGPRHDAEELRADATEALREAYETGTCTIVA
jgi:hypothetical protein